MPRVTLFDHFPLLDPVQKSHKHIITITMETSSSLSAFTANSLALRYRHFFSQIHCGYENAMDFHTLDT
jgi:hypothetical protein